MTKRNAFLRLLVALLLACGSLAAGGDARQWTAIRKWTGTIKFSVKHQEQHVESGPSSQSTTTIRVNRFLEANFTLEIDPDKLDVEENDIVLWNSTKCEIRAAADDEAKTVSVTDGRQEVMRYAYRGSGPGRDPCEFHLAIEAGPQRKARYSFVVPGAQIDAQLTAEITGAATQTVPQTLMVMLQDSEAQGVPPAPGEALTGTMTAEPSVFLGPIGPTQPLTAEVQWDLQPGGEQQRPSVTLKGCTDLIEGETATAQADGKPGRGSYRWWAEPPDPISISPLGANASLSGAAPGKTTIHVEYTGAGGKKAQASKAGTCVRIVSINGGEDIPKLGLYDAKGQPRSPTRSVSLALEPAGDLSADFPPADSSIASVVSHGSTLELQGTKCGTTTIQGQSRCGKKGGPVATVQVVACDDDVIAELTKQRDDLRRLIDQNLKQVAEVLNDPAFKNAENVDVDTAKAIADLAKVLTSANPVGQGIKNVGKVLSAASTINKYMKDDVAGVAKSAGMRVFKELVNGTVSTVVSIGNDLVSFGKSSAQVAAELGTIQGTWERMNELEARLNGYMQQFDVVDKRLNGTCKQASCRQTGGGQPGQGGPGQSGQSGGQAGQPGKSTPPGQQSPGTQPGTSAPGGETPGSGTGSGTSSGTGSGTGAGTGGPGPPGGGQQGGSQPGIPLDLNQPCKAESITGFNGATVGGYNGNLAQFQSVLQEVERAADLPDAERWRTFESAVPKLDAFASQTQTFDKDANAFLSETKDCGGQAKAAIGAINTRGKTATKKATLSVKQ